MGFDWPTSFAGCAQRAKDPAAPHSDLLVAMSAPLGLCPSPLSCNPRGPWATQADWIMWRVVQYLMQRPSPSQPGRVVALQPKPELHVWIMGLVWAEVGACLGIIVALLSKHQFFNCMWVKKHKMKNKVKGIPLNVLNSNFIHMPHKREHRLECSRM